MKSVKIILAVLSFAGAFLSSSSNLVASMPPAEIPAQITEDGAAMLFFFWGYLDAIDEIADLPAPEHRYSLRTLAAINRKMSTHFPDSPTGFAYFWGKSVALDREADRRGEP